MKNNIVKNIFLLSGEIKIVLLIMMSIFIFVIGYLLMVKATLVSLNGAQQKTNILKITFMQQQSQIKEYQQKEKMWLMINQKQNLPSALSLTQILTMIMLLSQENQVQVHLLEPQKLVGENQVLQQPIKVSLSGDYGHLTSWLQAIATSPLVIAIKQFTLKSLTPELNNLNLVATIVIYEWRQ